MTMTGTIEAMLRSHPVEGGSRDPEPLVRAIRELARCEQACLQCADACVAEHGGADLDACIHTDLACADACAMTRRVLSRRTGQGTRVVAIVTEACEELCNTCAAVCERHASHMAHCAECARLCRACAEACHDLLVAIA